MVKQKNLEDKLSSYGIKDKTVALAVASYLGGQAIIRNRYASKMSQEIKPDGSTVGELDLTSGQAITKYINSIGLNDVQFRSEEKMPFNKVTNPKFYGIFDDLDGSINPMIGGTNLHFIAVGGVIHQPNLDEQVSVAAYLPFGEPNRIYFAEKEKGSYEIKLDDLTVTKIELPPKPAQKNILVESGWMSPNTLKAEQALFQNGFYEMLGLTAKDRFTAGIFQTVSGIRDSRQVVLNVAPSHQADYCYLLLSEAGAEVVGQNGSPMYSTSYAMLSIAPSFVGDKEQLKEKFVNALHDYQGWNPGKVVMKKVCY